MRRQTFLRSTFPAHAIVTSKASPVLRFGTAPPPSNVFTIGRRARTLMPLNCASAPSEPGQCEITEWNFIWVIDQSRIRKSDVESQGQHSPANFPDVDRGSGCSSGHLVTDEHLATSNNHPAHLKTQQTTGRARCAADFR